MLAHGCDHGLLAWKAVFSRGHIMLVKYVSAQVYLRAKVITAIKDADLSEGSLHARPVINKSYKKQKKLTNKVQ